MGKSPETSHPHYTMKILKAGKRLMIAFATAGFVACGAGAVAEAAVINRVDWENVYNPDATTYNYLPNLATPGWTLGQTGGSASIVSNYLTISTDASATPTQNLFYTVGIQGGWDGNLAEGMTMEARFRVDPRGSNSRVTSIAVSNSKRYIYINIAHNTIYYSGGSVAGTIASGLNLSSDFNTIRMTLTQDLTLTIYLNGSSTPIGILTADSFSNGTSASNALSFGDAASNVGGTSYWDYIAWTPGIYSPVPEPGAFALLLPLTGYFAFRRKGFKRAA